MGLSHDPEIKFPDSLPNRFENTYPYRIFISALFIIVKKTEITKIGPLRTEWVVCKHLYHVLQNSQGKEA